MEDAKLTIQEKGEYKNIYLNEKEKIQVEGVGEITLPKLREEKYIDVEKLFAIPKEVESTKFPNPDGSPKKSYLYKVKYGGEEVSFFINKKKEADAFNVIGEVGDTIRISAETYDNKFGGKGQNLSFELM